MSPRMEVSSVKIGVPQRRHAVLYIKCRHAIKIASFCGALMQSLSGLHVDHRMLHELPHVRIHMSYFPPQNLRTRYVSDRGNEIFVVDIGAFLIQASWMGSILYSLQSSRDPRATNPFRHGKMYALRLCDGSIA